MIAMEAMPALDNVTLRSGYRIIACGWMVRGSDLFLLRLFRQTA